MKKNMAKIKITQIRSNIGSPQRQKNTLHALGLTKVNSSVEVEATPQILGMVTAVRHLVKVDQF
jgi:large subunit ribosomal protein L30